MSSRVTREESNRDRSERFGAAQAAVRLQAARIVRIVFGAMAVLLALGAVIVVLRSNIDENNSIVELITNAADAIAGPFSRDDGVLSFTGEDAEARNALLNWGIAAIVYLLVGRLLANAIAPKVAR